MRSPTTRRSSAGAGGTSICCGCGRRARPIRCGSTYSTKATTSRALWQQSRAEAISKVLYPSDDTPSGQELRLRQEYFFRLGLGPGPGARHVRSYGEISTLPQHAAIQLNDTHPSIAVAELMRVLLDLYRLPWDEAWRITRTTCSYTNHSLLPEALESWPVRLFETLLPRHLEIIYALNRDHLEWVQRREPDEFGLCAEGFADRRSRWRAGADGASWRFWARTGSTAFRCCTPS